MSALLKPAAAHLAGHRHDRHGAGEADAAAAGAHDHDHAGPVHADHDHHNHASHAHAHSRHPHAHHSHRPGERHPIAAPGFSLLRLSVWQRLALVIPLAWALWVCALLVISEGGM